MKTRKLVKMAWLIGGFGLVMEFFRFLYEERESRITDVMNRGPEGLVDLRVSWGFCLDIFFDRSL